MVCQNHILHIFTGVKIKTDSFHIPHYLFYFEFWYPNYFNASTMKNSIIS